MIIKKIYHLIIILIALFFSVNGAQGKRQDNDKKFTVIIDAGHGGKDIGATDNGVMEKNINLNVALQLESLIKKKLKNTNVVMTRDGDKFLTLQERADIANKNKGDLFISIHTNSVDKKNKNRKTIEGSSVYALGLHKDENNKQVAMRENSVIELENDYEKKYSGFDPLKDESYIIFEMAQKKNLSQSIRFAENVEKELIKSGRSDRGVHQAGFWVLWATSMPSVLIELDFICNPQSAKYLSSSKGAKELAEAIFKAIENYENTWQKNNNIIAQEKDNDKEFEEVAVITESSVPIETYAVASVRKKKIVPESEFSYRKAIDKSNHETQRKRRSHTSKIKANEISYEKEWIPLGKERNMTSEVVIENENLTPNLIAKEDSNAEKNKKKQKKEKKPKESKKKSNTKERSRNAKVEKFVTVYKIQILASEDLLKQNNSRFCGLSPISTYKENNLYKYYYGESTDRNEMEGMLINVRKKIPDAFIVSSTKSVNSAKN